MSELPNIVLVHAAWADGGRWTAVIKALQADGYNVAARSSRRRRWWTMSRSSSKPQPRPRAADQPPTTSRERVKPESREERLQCR